MAAAAVIRASWPAPTMPTTGTPRKATGAEASAGLSAESVTLYSPLAYGAPQGVVFLRRSFVAPQSSRRRCPGIACAARSRSVPYGTGGRAGGRVRAPRSVQYLGVSLLWRRPVSLIFRTSGRARVITVTG